MQQQAEHYDNAEHEHVLGSPFHLFGLVGNSIAVVTARLTVLQRKDDGIDEVQGNQHSQTAGGGHSIPVGTEHFAHHVVTFFGEESHQVHATMKREEQNERNAGYRHDYLPSDG